MRERFRVQKFFRTPSRTKQSFKAESDINSIVAKYQRTGLVTNISGKKPFYGDVSSVPDYQDALALVAHAQDQFSKLPAKLRERLGNDPEGLVRYLSDESNWDDAVKLGLMLKKEPLAPPVPPVAPPVPPVASPGVP